MWGIRKAPLWLNVFGCVIPITSFRAAEDRTGKDEAMTVQKYTLSEKELAIINEAAEKSLMGLRETITEFVLHGLHNELPERLVASAIAQHVLNHVAESMCVLYGMSADDVRVHNDALECLTIRLQKQVVVAVAEFVRTHMDDADLYVSPEDRKQNDAAENADYEYDRDKEERRRP